MLGSVVSVQEFPSYLKEFFEEDVKCRMIYGQVRIEDTLEYIKFSYNL